MKDGQYKEVGICAGLGLSRELPMDGGSTHAHKEERKLKTLNKTTAFVL